MKRSTWFGLLLLISILVLVLDVVTGPFLLFPVLFVIPVGFAAWHLDRNIGIAFAVVLVACRFGIVVTLEPETMPVWAAALNAIIRLSVLIGLAVLVAKIAQQSRLLASRVQTLEGLLPICSFCKKIRRPDGEWEQIESYVTKRSEAQFSHGICNDCGKKHYGDFFKPSNT